MLTVKPITSSAQKIELFHQFDPNTQTWVVADLKSKLELQKLLLSERELLEENAILRATELWKKLLMVLRPEMRVINKPLMVTMISQWLKDDVHIEWAQAPGAASTLFQYMDQFLPILAHPEGTSLLQSWFEQNKQSYVRWGSWYELSRMCWEHFNSQGVIASAWVAGVLVNQKDLASIWQRDLVFDLCSQLSAVESDLIQQLSRERQAVVLEPAVSWGSAYTSSLLGYRLLHENLELNSLGDEQGGFWQPPQYVQLKKYTTMLAEIKAVTAQIRDWLNEGVAPNKVAILAPEIETYWATLKNYLREEGIPVEKEVVTPVQSYAEINQWLARLRMNSGNATSADLELCLYGRTAHQLSYEEFKRLFTAVYDASDLQREQKVAQLFSVEINPDARIKRDEFVAWALHLWDVHAPVSMLEKVFHQFFQECPLTTTLQLSNWLGYLENICSKLEICIVPATVGGIHCVNVDSAEHVDVSHVCCIGVNESALRRTDATAVSFSDILSLSQQTGFNLSFPDKNHQEFELRWLLEKPYSQVVISTPATDFAGNVEAPSLMWLTGVISRDVDVEAITVPKLTRWDELQRAHLNDIANSRNWEARQRTQLEDSLAQDLGVNDPAPFAEGMGFNLSVSQLENYSKCPFVFAAQKLFGLSDLPTLDLDVDHLTRGKLMHAVFEKLTEEPIEFDRTREELENIVDQCRQEEKLVLADDRLWPALRNKHVDLALQFLEYEKNWRQLFPKTKTIGREVKIEGVWDEKSASIVPEAPEGIPFRGFIDRVDTDTCGHYVVLDYKSSANGLTQPNSWVKNDSLQLLVYSQAIQNGCAEGLEPGPVVGGYYFVARPMDRNKGFGLESAVNLIPTDKPKKLMTDDEIKGLYAKANERINGLINEMRQGYFAPKPKDKKECDNCQWKELCRAPHLN